MKRQKYIFYFGMFLVLALAGCPYESSVPISEASIKPPKNLFGKWMEPTEIEKNNPTHYQIEKKDKYHVLVSLNEYNTTDEKWDTTIYEAFLSEVDDNEYVNLKEVGASKYLLYKIVWNTDDEFTLHEVTNNIKEEFTSPGELKSFISEHQHLSFFFNKDATTYIKRQ